MKKRIITLIVLLAISAVFGLFGCDGESDQIAESEQTTDVVETENASLDVPTFTGEENTTERVDEIISKAIEDAKTVNDNQIDIALSYIKAHWNDPFESNEVMESIMYYGSVLEYGSSNDVILNLGMDAVQTVKYVYRGTESETDQHVTENIRQVNEAFNEL